MDWDTIISICSARYYLIKVQFNFQSKKAIVESSYRRSIIVASIEDELDKDPLINILTLLPASKHAVN